MTGYVDISQAGVALGQNSTKYVSLSSSASGALTLQGATSSDTVRLSGLAAPTQSSDAVTKAHMETYIASAVGGMSVKEDCYIASTSQTALQLQNGTVKWDNLTINTDTKILKTTATSTGAAYPSTPFAGSFSFFCKVPNLAGIPLTNDSGATLAVLGANGGHTVNLWCRSSVPNWLLSVDSDGGTVRRYWNTADIDTSKSYYIAMSTSMSGSTATIDLNLYDATTLAVVPSTSGDARFPKTGPYTVSNWSVSGDAFNISTGNGSGGNWQLAYETVALFKDSALSLSAALALASAPATAVIDGVTLTSGMRVLLTGQTDAIQNGIYVVGSSALARTSDLAVGALASGAFCFVTGGSSNGHKGFVCNALPGAETVGTHTLQWTVFTSEDGKIGTTTIAGGVITDASGAISLVNNSLTTSGQITAGSQHVGTLRLASGTVYDTSGALSLGSTSVTTSGSVTAASLTAVSHIAGTLSLTAASLTDSSGSISMSSTSLATSGNMSAAHFTSSSDERLKSDIKPLATTLEDIQKVRGVSFKWVSTESADTGVIAQEIQQIAPECVHQDERSGYLQVDYARLVPYLIEWIRQLAARKK